MMRLKSVLLILAITFSSAASLAIDLSGYELTAVQHNLLVVWEAEGKFDDQKLLELAKSFDAFNKKPKPYIPAHTAASLQAVTDWAEGSAFAYFARFTTYQFDSARYEADCPDRALFNFGYATGTEFLRRDVLEKAIFSLNALTMYLRTQPDEFSKVYLELAQARGFDGYISENIQLSELVN